MVRMSRSGLAAASAATASSRWGMKTSSASRVATKSPRAARTASFLAAAGPALRSSRMSFTRPPTGASAPAMSSVEASSQTITSSGGSVWSSADATASPIVSAASYAAMTTENVGVGPGSTGTAGAGARNRHSSLASLAPSARPPPARSAFSSGASAIDSHPSFVARRTRCLADDASRLDGESAHRPA